jgi:hypothetical protein
MTAFPLFLDLLMIALLGATIFYAFRLSRHLETFRSNRSEMERLIRDLSTQITRAQEGISALEETAGETGKELRDLVLRGKELSDELQLMTEAGNSLATRLEDLATRNRVIAEETRQAAVNTVYPGAKPLAAKPVEWPTPDGRSGKSKSSSDVGDASFMIRDPDFGADDLSEGSKDADDFGFESQAERDLAAALRRRKP